MSSPVRKMFSHSAVYTLGFVINRLLPFLLLPVYTKYFLPEEFGYFSLVYSFWFFTAVFYLYGMESSFQKIYIESDTERRKKVYGTSMMMIAVSSFVFSLVVYLFAEPISILLLKKEGFTHLIKLVAIILFIDALSRFPMILLNSLELTKAYTIINLFGIILNFAANIIFIVYLNLGIISILYAFVISFAVVFIISFIYTLKYFSFGFDKTLTKELFAVGKTFLLFGIFLVTVDLSDRFFLMYLKSESEVGIYSACYRIGMVMNLIITGFRVAWIPFFMNMKDKEDSHHVYGRVLSYFCFGSFALFLVVCSFINEVVNIKLFGFKLLEERYMSGLVIVPFILAAYFFLGFYTNINIQSYLKNKIGYLNISTGIAAGVNIILNLVLIKYFSFTGAAIATMISYFVMCVVIYFLTKNISEIKYDWKLISRGFALVVVCYVINFFLTEPAQNFEFNPTNFIIKFVLVVLTIMALYFMIRPRKII